MNQRVEIFFAAPPDNSVEAVVMPRMDERGPSPLQISFAYRLVGRYAVMDPIVCEQWEAVVVSSPEFAKAMSARPGKNRPQGTSLCFMALQPSQSAD